MSKAQYMREYRQRPENAEKHRKWSRAWSMRNPEKVKVQRLRARLRMYGLTLEEYEDMLAEQGGVCAICGQPNPGDKSLHIDHDHETGVVRGLLCVVCNHTLGRLGDSVEGIQKFVRYLEGAHV